MLSQQAFCGPLLERCSRQNLLFQKFCAVTQHLLIIDVIDEVMDHCLRMTTSHEMVEISGILSPGFTCGTCHPCHSNIYKYMVLIRWRETPRSTVMNIGL